MNLYKITFVRTGEEVIGDSDKCSSALRMNKDTFYTTVARQARQKGQHRWYKIERIGTVERGSGECPHRGVME